MRPATDKTQPALDDARPAGDHSPADDVQEPLPGVQPSPDKILRPIARPRTRREKERHRALIAEFRKWKLELIDMIKRSSRMEIAPDGSVAFLFPPRLVKIILAVADRERLKIVEGWKEDLRKQHEEPSPPSNWPPAEDDLHALGVVDDETKSDEGDGELQADRPDQVEQVEREPLVS